MHWTGCSSHTRRRDPARGGLARFSATSVRAAYTASLGQATCTAACTSTRVHEFKHTYYVDCQLTLRRDFSMMTSKFRSHTEDVSHCRPVGAMVVPCARRSQRRHLATLQLSCSNHFRALAYCRARRAERELSARAAADSAVPQR
eukprot:6774959-Prymnesium_polylepis.2